jgi:hypothetical protein
LTRIDPAAFRLTAIVSSSESPKPVGRLAAA